MISELILALTHQKFFFHSCLLSIKPLHNVILDSVSTWDLSLRVKNLNHISKMLIFDSGERLVITDNPLGKARAKHFLGKL